MFKIRDKLERSLSKRRSENIFLRLFRSDADLQPSVVGLTRPDQEDFRTDSQKSIRNALLGAEREKAMAIMALQRQHQRVC